MKLQSLTRFTSYLRRALIGVAGLAVLVMTIAWLSGMFEDKVEPGWQEPGVRRLADQPTDEVHEVTKEYMEEAVGTFKAASRTVVSSKVMATIEEIPVTAGDQVEEDELLVRLDNDEYRSRLEQAKQALQAAKANREQAQKDYDRTKSLFERKVVTRAELERFERDLQVATANESRAKEAVSEAEVLLSYTTIEAAKSGRIVDRYAEPGDVAQPGEPILVLYDAGSLRLETPVTENLAIKLKPGQKLDVYVDALDETLTATVEEIVPQADAPSRSFLVKASVPRSPDLYEGMFGRLFIPAGERRHLCLATDAVTRIGQLEYVDVVLPDGTLERRLIKSGRLGLPGRMEVLSGLQAGERVVVHLTPTQNESEADDK
jgi:RND family efflux transporter MFP subunit